MPFPPFTYRNRNLFVEEVDLEEIARSAGTPVYVYSATAIRERYRRYDDAFDETPHEVFYAVKANSNLSVLRLLASEGAGFDIVSGGELYRVMRAGGPAEKVVFSGVGKTREEVEYALSTGIHSFNCESEAELALIDSIASRMGKTARIAMRVNPHVDAQTHPYISTGLRDHKFGIDIAAVEAVYARAAQFSHIAAEGVSCHIGSQLLDTAPLKEALDAVLELVERLRANGVPIRHLDLGGGLGVPYKPEQEEPDVTAHIQAVCERCAGHDLKLMMEPGRSIVGPAGVLLSRVLYRKSTDTKEFVVVDAAMNDLIRPALYQAYHEIVPLRQHMPGTVTADVVGPVCETGDFFARDREMANVLPGDFVALCTAGAYGFVQASNYNSRPRPAEVLVEGASWKFIRTRETSEDLIRGE
ncbi:MAG: diaminopimelate decarboxylase [Acidobacteria bacterium]|nr:diaminopimelate decarboxylase [Acidobacteriota bacterium]